MPVKQPRPGELDPIETASRDEIAALQLQRLKDTLQRTYAQVPHYRRKFEQAGVHPDDLHTLADLAKFPFTTKADLRDSYPLIRSSCKTKVVIKTLASGNCATRAFIEIPITQQIWITYIGTNICTGPNLALRSS